MRFIFYPLTVVLSALGMLFFYLFDRQSYDKLIFELETGRRVD